MNGYHSSAAIKPLLFTGRLDVMARRRLAETGRFIAETIVVEERRIERMAIVDRNILRLAVYEFLYEDTPHTVVINEALEIARRFSTFEATQFINGILDAIKHDLEKKDGKGSPDDVNGKSQVSSI